MNHAPKGPSEAPDLGALSELAPELAQTFVSIASDIALVIDAGGVIRSVATGSAPIAPATEWIGRPWAETVTGDTRTKIEQLLSEAQTSGVTRRREVNHPSDSGTDIPVAYAAIRLGRDGPVLAVGRDLRAVSAIQQRFIDAQQEMEREYWQQRQSETRYRMLFQVANDAVLVVDAADADHPGGQPRRRHAVRPGHRRTDRPAGQHRHRAAGALGMSTSCCPPPGCAACPARSAPAACATMPAARCCWTCRPRPSAPTSCTCCWCAPVPSTPTPTPRRTGWPTSSSARPTRW